MKKPAFFCLFFFCLVLAFAAMLYGCRQELTEEQAAEAMQNYVNGKMRFYVKSGDQIVNATSADIQLVQMIKKDNAYNFFIAIESNATGEIKRKGVMIPIDAFSGDVIEKNIVDFKLE